MGKKNPGIEELCRMRQQEEWNSWVLYEKIAQTVKNEKERETLETISKDERKHALLFQKYAGVELKPNLFLVRIYLFLCRMLGYTFLIKFLERGEARGIAAYRELLGEMPEMKQILADEERHEGLLLGMLDEERLHYVGDIVLGMNDALVELTGSLAGYTLAMQNTRIIAMAGLITGISATLSMAGSGYLAAREEASKNAVKSTVTIGLSYLITVALLILPYLLFPVRAYISALIVTIAIALLIIGVFNYYLSVAKDRPFGRGFWTMAGISVGVAVVSFLVGFVVKNVLGIKL